eukprot:GHVU01032378.1.p1 GENE.GHVU01032378.1~~GHVU01032378.1.p1  ORF type:complete len:126 (-),score=9.95 GHVU01032378.1:159-536(-)
MRHGQTRHDPRPSLCERPSIASPVSISVAHLSPAAAATSRRVSQSLSHAQAGRWVHPLVHLERQHNATDRSWTRRRRETGIKKGIGRRGGRRVVRWKKKLYCIVTYHCDSSSSKKRLTHSLTHSV